MALIPPEWLDELPVELKGDMRVYIRAWSSIANTLQINGITRHGKIAFRHVLTSDRLNNIAGFPISEMPLFIDVRASGEPVHGQVYAYLELKQGLMDLMTLGSGYLTKGGRLSFPPGRTEHMEEGPGNIRLVTGTDPAAGNEVSEAVPTNALWRIIDVRAALVTDATAVDRRVYLVIDDGTTTFYYQRANVVQAASLTYTYYGVAGLPVLSANEGIRQPIFMPDLLLPQGYRIRTATGNIEAGDNWAAPQILVEEWIQE